MKTALLILGALVVFATVAYVVAARGPWSFRAAYEDAVARRAGDAPATTVLTEADLTGLPVPVARYVRTSGALGRPRPWRVQARWRGRIRGEADGAWMPFTAEQTNVLFEPSRFFLMDATRGGIPVDVYHDFEDGHAAMRVRLLSLVPLVDARGPEMDRAETVTLFNDLVLLAPGALVDAPIEWEPIDGATVRGTYTVGPHAVSAELHFADDGRLTDFISDDRLAASADGASFEPRRWSTPIGEYQEIDGLRLLRRGEGRWHPKGSNDFTYIELELLEVSY